MPRIDLNLSLDIADDATQAEIEARVNPAVEQIIEHALDIAAGNGLFTVWAFPKLVMDDEEGVSQP